jgi:hypothetical protein
MKKNKIPTFIAMAVLVFGLAAAVLLVNSKQIFRLGASADETPRDVRVSNVSDSSFVVSWTTDKETVGYVSWGKSEDSQNETEADSIGTASSTHYAVIKTLSPQTTYFYKINSNGTEYDNNSIPWQTTTGIALAEPSEANIISGSVLTATGEAAKNALVYVIVGGGSIISTVTSQNGSWLIPLSSLRTQNLNQYFLIDNETTLLEISVNAGSFGVSSSQTYPQSSKPLPPMILGQVHEFKSLPANSDSELPSANINLPEDTTPTSGFNTQDITSLPTKTVTLTSVDEGEIISTVEPEFFGQGPTGTTLSITVESELQTDTVNVSSNGSWNWTPPQNLEPGTHKITVSWRDAGGILRTLTRNFVVQASELPAFQATPSASLKPTTSPTVKPTSTVTATPKYTATSSAVPQPISGNLTPTLVLTIMGIGSMIFGFFLWKKSEI